VAGRPGGGRGRGRLGRAAVARADAGRPGARARPAGGAGGRAAPGLPQPCAAHRARDRGRRLPARRLDRHRRGPRDGAGGREPRAARAAVAGTLPGLAAVAAGPGSGNARRAPASQLLSRPAATIPALRVSRTTRLPRPAANIPTSGTAAPRGRNARLPGTGIGPLRPFVSVLPILSHEV